MGNSLKKPKTGLYVFIAVLVLAAGLIAYGRWSQRPAADGGRYIGFAQCLKDSGATFYGTFWCPHCADQKEKFGSAVDGLPYVECSTADGRGQLPVCTEAGIEGYPTWEFADGSRVSGTQTLESLAEATGCALPE